MAAKQRARRWTVLACLVVVAVQVVMLAALTQRDDAGSPHRVPIVIAAPAVVAQELAHEADAMPRTPFDASWTDDEDEARARVRDGRAVAAVLVDLRTTRDVVIVSARADPGLNDAVVEHLTSVERARERTIEVQHVGATTDAASRVRWYVVLCGLVGFGFVLVVSLLRGPVAPTIGRGIARLGGLAIASVGGAALLQAVPATSLGGNPMAVIGVGAAYAFTLGAITLAVETLTGLVGLAATAAVYFVLATPVLSGTSRYLLPEPWPRVAPWMPIGAAHDALANVAYFAPGRAVPQLLVIAAAAFLAVVALLLARELRGAVPGGAAAAERTMPVRHWRAWVLGAVLPLAVLLGVGIALVPTEPVAAQALPSVASETTCVDKAGRPSSVGDLNDQIQHLQGSPAFQGADVGADVQLHDGRFLLVFGDTIRGASFDGPRFVRNSMMLWDTDCVSVVLPQSKGALIPDRPDGVGYWPMSSAVAHRPGYDLVMVSTQRVKATGGGSFDFANLGPSLAVFVVQDGGTPQLIATEDIGADSADKSRPTWGAALAVDDDWLYGYGTANPDEPGVFGFSLQVARVHPDDALDASKWRYWNGSGWGKDPGRADVLLPATGGVSQTLSVFHEGERWYALSKRDGDLGDQLVVWTAPGPTGPFTPTDPVATLPSDPSTGAVTYMPLAHPRILPEDGTMVVSYSRNNTDFQKIEDDPKLYRPRFLRVPLPD